MAITSEPLKLSLVGYGKMGKLVEKIAFERGHEIVPYQEADICIDFTHPEAAIENIRKLAPLKKNLVVGTTGWYSHLPEVKELVEKYQIGFFYSPNFSLGVQLFLEAVKEAAKLFLPYPEYQVAGLEMHHHEKKDSPSGTALAIQSQIKQPMEFTSIRCGHIPGTHTVIFDSKADQITLTHEARSREGFALGAVKAAEWLKNKKGIYTMEAMINS